MDAIVNALSNFLGFGTQEATPPPAPFKWTVVTVKPTVVQFIYKTEFIEDTSHDRTVTPLRLVPITFHARCAHAAVSSMRASFPKYIADGDIIYKSACASLDDMHTRRAFELDITNAVHSLDQQHKDAFRAGDILSYHINVITGNVYIEHTPHQSLSSSSSSPMESDVSTGSIASISS